MRRTPAPLVLVTNPATGHHLGEYLRRHAPRTPVARSEDVAVLDRLCGPGTLLIAFCTATLIPARILNRLGRPAYNFHPGPPNHPGVRPEAFALYNGDTVFGATAHEMAPKVDSGPIVGVEMFEVPPHLDQRGLGEMAFGATVRLFVRLSPAMLAGRPLPHLDVAWAPRPWTFADYRDLRTIPPGASADEVARRLRCTHADPERPAILHTGDGAYRLWPV